jgi:hypothetical protein
VLVDLNNRELRRIQRSRHYRSYKEAVRWRKVVTQARHEQNMVKLRYALAEYHYWHDAVFHWAKALLPKVRGA